MIVLQYSAKWLYIHTYLMIIELTNVRTHQAVEDRLFYIHTYIHTYIPQVIITASSSSSDLRPLTSQVDRS